MLEQKQVRPNVWLPRYQVVTHKFSKDVGKTDPYWIDGARSNSPRVKRQEREAKYIHLVLRWKMCVVYFHSTVFGGWWLDTEADILSQAMCNRNFQINLTSYAFYACRKRRKRTNRCPSVVYFISEPTERTRMEFSIGDLNKFLGEFSFWLMYVQYYTRTIRRSNRHLSAYLIVRPTNKTVHDIYVEVVRIKYFEPFFRYS